LLYAIWNLRGRRLLIAKLAGGGKPEAVDAINRPFRLSVNGSDLALIASELPIYFSGGVIQSLMPGANVPADSPRGKPLALLDDPEAWTADSKPDKTFEAPLRGVPRVRGPFDVTAPVGCLPSGERDGKRLTFTLQPLASTHGLIPRYISLTARPGQEIPIPNGTTRLGIWVHGNSTWAQVKFGVRNADGKTRLMPNYDFAGRMADNFDGWRFLDTGNLVDDALQSGSCRLDRIVVTMPERQVYVDQLRTTAKPQISIWGLRAIRGQLPAVSYLPW
jgi:hypothetical protein